MGQTNLYRIEARAGWWIPTFDFGKQVFSIVGRTGTVQGYGGKDVPYFERFFLGGGYNMRGFKYRKVGKLDPTTEESSTRPPKSLWAETLLRLCRLNIR